MMRKKKITFKKLLTYLVPLAAGMILGLVMAGLFLPYLEENPVGGLILMALLWISLTIQTILHELGHMVFGLATGYRFSSFRIGSLMLAKENERLRIRRLHIAGTDGQCLMVPPETVRGKPPVVLYNLGGCLFNLIFAILALGLYFCFPGNSFLTVFFLCLFLSGLVLALVNGIPFSAGPVPNDAANAIMMAKNTRAAEALWIQLRVNDRLSQGQRLGQMPEEWFFVPSDAEMKNGLTAAVAVLFQNRLMDQHKFPEAAALTEQLLSMESGIVGLHRSLLVCDKIYLEVLGENREAVLQELLTQEQKGFMQSMKGFPSVLRTNYTLALHTKLTPKPVEFYQKQFEKTARGYPYPVDIQTERELMEFAKQKQPGTLVL